MVTLDGDDAAITRKLDLYPSISLELGTRVFYKYATPQERQLQGSALYLVALCRHSWFVGLVKIPPQQAVSSTKVGGSDEDVNSCEITFGQRHHNAKFG